MSKVLKAQKELNQERKIKFSLLSINQDQNGTDHGSASARSDQNTQEASEASQVNTMHANYPREQKKQDFSPQHKRSDFRLIMPVLFLFAIFGSSLMVFSLKIHEELKTLEATSSELQKTFLAQDAKFAVIDQSVHELKTHVVTAMDQVKNNLESSQDLVKTSQTDLSKMSSQVTDLNAELTQIGSNLEESKARLKDLYSAHLAVQTMITDMNEKIQQLPTKLNQYPERISGNENPVK